MKTLAISMLALAAICLISLAGQSSATPPNVKVNSDTSPYLQNEQQIWISPFDADIVLADWRDFRLGYRRVGIGVSTDGGTTWSDSLFDNTPYLRHSDPCLTGDLLGRFYACMLNYVNSDGGQSLIVVYRSDDNGVSWSCPVSISAEGDHFEDKQFTTVDRTGSAHSGNYYCSWTRFPNPTRIIFVRSTDGAQTFDDTIKVGPEVWVPEWQDYWDVGQFSIPVVDADGDVHVFWQGYDLQPGPAFYSATKHVYSTDGGQTFSEPETAFLNLLSYWDVDGGVDVYGMPNADCDISGGPYHGTIYISQCQFKEGSDPYQTDVTVRKSTDKGATWTDRYIVNDDPPDENVDQFHPWLVVNEDGVVLLIFYDQRDDPNHYLFNAYFSASFDGGETYITNMRISDVSIDPSLALRAYGPPLVEPVAADGRILLDRPLSIGERAGLFAEYIGIHARHDTVNTIWTDTRNGNQDCYAARFIIPFQVPRLYYPPDDTLVTELRPDFLWSTCWHETEDSYRLEIDDDPGFGGIDYSFSGLTDNTHSMGSDLPSGWWYWRVKAFRSAGDSTDYSAVYAVAIGQGDLCGDVNGDMAINSSDVVYIVDYIFADGPAPDPLSIADVNCSGAVNMADAVYLVAYLLGSGPEPCAACP
jgi:hypothetical protein